MVNKQFVVPGNGSGGGRRDTVGSEVSDDDNKMVICEDRPPDAHHDHTKTGQCRQASRFSCIFGLLLYGITNVLLKVKACPHLFRMLTDIIFKGHEPL